jgi:DNA-binding transcriptional ArsR family regulator
VTVERCDLLCLDLETAESLRLTRVPPAVGEAAARRARAMGDPTRLAIAAALAGVDELCVCDIAWIAERSESLVGHHLRALRQAGLVRSRRQGKMVLYRITDAGRALVAAVLAEVPEGAAG